MTTPLVNVNVISTQYRQNIGNAYQGALRIKERLISLGASSKSIELDLMGFHLQALSPSLLAILLSVFIMLVAGTTPSLAGSLGDLDARLRQSSGIKAVEVSMERLRPYESVKKLPQRNCTYASDEPKKITALLKAFVDYNTRLMPDNRVFLPIVEIEIHLHFKNGQRTVLYLGKRYLGEKTIDGELTIDGQLGSKFFWANRDLSERLLQWAQVADEVLPDYEDIAISSRDVVQECRDKASGKIRSGGPAACGKHMLSHPEVCGQN